MCFDYLTRSHQKLALKPRRSTRLTYCCSSMTLVAAIAMSGLAMVSKITTLPGPIGVTEGIIEGTAQNVSVGSGARFTAHASCTQMKPICVH